MDTPVVDPTNPKPKQELPEVPDTWPGAFGIFKYSKRAFMLNIETILVLIVVEIAVSLILSRLGMLGSIIGDVVALAINVALLSVYLASVRGHKVPVASSFDAVTPSMFLNYFILVILLYLAFAVSILLFIVPFFFVLPRLVLAPYFLIDKRLDSVSAIKASWAATKGHSGKVWGVLGVSLLFAILCIVLVGIYFSFMYMAALPVLYLYLSEKAGVPADNSNKGWAVPA